MKMIIIANKETFLEKALSELNSILNEYQQEHSGVLSESQIDQYRFEVKDWWKAKLSLLEDVNNELDNSKSVFEKLRDGEYEEVEV